MIPRAAVLALALASLAGCAGESSPGAALGGRSDTVIGGSVDSSDDAVVSLMTTPDASAPELCTAVLIAPRALLTAAHCLTDQTPETLVVGTGKSASAPASRLAVASLHIHPSYHGTADDRQNGLDLGIVLLAVDATIVPLSVSPDPVAAGTEVQVIGYGQSDGGDMDTRGTRRAASAPVSSACSGLLGFGSSTVAACHGDSGGPLLASGRVVGIVSYGESFACDPPSFATRVDRFSGWIARVVSGGDDACGPDCVTDAPDCEPLDAGADASDATDASDGADVPDAVAGGGSSVTPSVEISGGCAFSAPTGSAGFGAFGVLAAGLFFRGRRGSPRRLGRGARRAPKRARDPVASSHHASHLRPPRLPRRRRLLL